MDNVKNIRQFLIENSDLVRHFFHEHPDDTIKVPAPHLIFREHEEYNNTFIGLSLKYFKSFVINMMYLDIKNNDGGWYLYIRPGYHLNPFLSRTKITDDENVLDIDHILFGIALDSDEDTQMCKDILAYIKAGVQTFYHKEENNADISTNVIS